MSRPILAQLHRHNTVGTLATTDILWTKHFSRFSNAVRRCSELAFLTGQPGDVIEFVHTATGTQLGTAKVHSGGRLILTWHGDSPRVQELLHAVTEARI